MNQNSKKHKMMKKSLTAFAVLFTISIAFAQSGGSAALGAAATTISGYITDLGLLIYAIGAIVGTVGGIRIYNKWTNGDQDINKEIVGWGGACIFLLLVPTFIAAIF